jgi:hypothetical protein
MPLRRSGPFNADIVQSLFRCLEPILGTGFPRQKVKRRGGILLAVIDSGKTRRGDVREVEVRPFCRLVFGIDGLVFLGMVSHVGTYRL